MRSRGSSLPPVALLAAVALSCTPSLPDQIVEGRWVRYRYWSDEGPPCPEAVQHIDRFVEQSSARLGERPAPIDYFKLRSLAELQTVPHCAIPHAGGCAVEDAVYALTWTQDHEVTHAVASRLGYPPQLFVEGLAVVTGCGPARFSGAPLQEVDLAALVDNTAWAKELSWPTYLQAAAFTRFLIDHSGQTAFNGFYAATAHGADPATLDARMTAAFGLTFAEALAQWRAGPAPREGEACLPFDDVCEGAAGLALTAVGATGQFEGTVSCGACLLRSSLRPHGQRRAKLGLFDVGDEQPLRSLHRLVGPAEPREVLGDGEPHSAPSDPARHAGACWWLRDRGRLGAPVAVGGGVLLRGAGRVDLSRSAASVGEEGARPGSFRAC